VQREVGGKAEREEKGQGSAGGGMRNGAKYERIGYDGGRTSQTGCDCERIEEETGQEVSTISKCSSLVFPTLLQQLYHCISELSGAK
jgi:hypothetical protein